MEKMMASSHSTSQRLQPVLPQSPHARMSPMGPGTVRWTEGFWADHFARVRSQMIPAIHRALNDPDNGAVLSNFYVAAGLQEGGHQGTFWSDGDCYKWMEAIIHVLGVVDDPELDRLLDELIDVIARAQEPDGYICTQVQLTDKGRWQAPQFHELYNMGHLITAACAHHRVTGKENFLQVARKLADYLYQVFQPRPPELANFGWNPSNIMALVDLYRITGETRYLELAQTFVDMRGSAPKTPGRQQDDRGGGGTDQIQDRIPLRQETEAVGHAVTATYLYSGAADVYMETGEQALLEALQRIWLDMTTRKMYITGGVGTHHHAVSKRGDRIWEAFGLDYQLPNATAYNETCANIGNAMWNWRMLRITGEARFSDIMELVAYNTLLSGVSMDGTHFCYTNPLRWYGAEHLLLSQDAPTRWHTFHCYCCPPQVARTIAQLHEWAYSLSPEGLWIHLYGGNTLETSLDGTSSIRLKQETNYPWDGYIKITLTAVPTHPMALMLRIPGWATGATLRVNGEHWAEQPQPGTYAVLKRSWSPGDVIELDLPMEPRLVKAHPKVEEAANHVAIMRGPVVYCLESVDLPPAVSMDEIYIPRDVRPVVRYDEELLGGLATLELDAWVIHGPPWDGQLYRILGGESRQPVQVRLIPYYAWNNRGETQMTVWLPLC
ncbi:hypothetical protein RY27_06495 [Litorilinea aerophila]|nr:hypothetical protein RY27_06495 [Litorilinea aerophila]